MNRFQHLLIAITLIAAAINVEHFDKASDAVDVIVTDRTLETRKETRKLKLETPRKRSLRALASASSHVLLASVEESVEEVEAVSVVEAVPAVPLVVVPQKCRTDSERGGAQRRPAQDMSLKEKMSRLSSYVVPNVGLLPVKMHWFLYCGAAVGVMPFATVIAKQLGISASLVGILNTVLLFVAVVMRFLVGSLTDKVQRLKIIIMVVISIEAFFHFMIIVVPPITPTKLNVRTTSPECRPQNSTMHICFTEELSNDCPGADKSDCTLSCFHTTLNSSHEGKFEMPFSSGRMCGTKTWCSPLNTEGQSDNHGKFCAAENKTCSANCLAPNQTSTFRTSTFWLYAGFRVLAGIAFGVGMSLTDTATYAILRDRKEDYGKQRLWGTIGWGGLAPVVGYLNQMATAGSSYTDYRPGFYMLAALAVMDVIGLSFLEVPRSPLSKQLLKDVGKVFVNVRTVFFTIAVFNMGFLMGFIWTYALWYMEELGGSPQLLGANLAVQCFGGEVPILFFSGWIIRKIGYGNAVSVSIGGMALSSCSLTAGALHSSEPNVLVALAYLSHSVTDYSTSPKPRVGGSNRKDNQTMQAILSGASTISRLRLSNVVQLKCHIFILFGSFATVLPHTSVEAHQIGIAAPLVGILMAVVPFCTVLVIACLPHVGTTIRHLKYAIILTLVGQSTCHLLSTRCSRPEGLRSTVTLQPRCSSRNTSLYACMEGRMTESFNDVCWADDYISPYTPLTLLTCVLECGCFCDGKLRHCLIKDSRNLHCNDTYCQHFEVSKFLFFCDHKQAPSCWLSCSPKLKLGDDGTDWSTDRTSIFRKAFWMHAAGRRQTWCFLILRLAGIIFSGVALTLTTTTTVLIMEDANDQSDTQRIWGSAGWGILSILSGHINNRSSTQDDLIDFSPGVLLMAFMNILDIVIIIPLRIPKKEIKPQHLHQSVIGVYRKVRTQLYMALCFLMGSLSGAIWVFGPLRLRLLGADVTVLAAVAAAQSLGGELVHSHVSDRMIRHMGVGNAVNASILSMFMRLMGYSFNPWPWYIVPLELAQGLTMGLFVKGSVILASMEFEEGTDVQLQQTLYTIYHGVGACFGAFGAGFLFNLLDPSRTYMVCSIAALLAFYAHFVASQCFLKIERHSATPSVNDLEVLIERIHLARDQLNDVDAAIEPLITGQDAEAEFTHGIDDHQLPPSSGPGAISKKEHHYWRSRQDCVSGPRRRGLHYGIGGQRLDAALVEPSKEKAGPPSSLKIGPPSYFVVAELPLTRCRPTPARNARVYSSDIIFVPDYSEERAASVIQWQSLTLRLMKGVLTPMPSSDTLVPSWFDTVENVFERYMVPERLRGYLVRPYFTESMRALVNRLNVGERSVYGAVKERILLELGLSRAEVWRPFIETTSSLKKKHKNPRQGIIPENSRMKCFKCKELGHLSRECPRKKTPDEELLFHKKRVDAENVTVEENCSCEPDKVTTDVGKTEDNNLDHQGQKRPDPSVREAPQILLQADNTKRSSKNNRSCVSVQADVDDRNELNVSRAWRTSQRAEDDHDEQTFWQADDDHGKDAGVDKQSVILVGWLTSQQAGEDVRESGDSDEDAVFEMKSSKNITRDAGEDSTTCQAATCERDGSAEDVDNGDRLRGPFLIESLPRQIMVTFAPRTSDSESA
ncbi:hypothetical protein HPB47_021568 [Ixodes persulcatus]|uniref:Uncharacterized protein n=1 Tax=Ixodes persulcatus TaxID=34615 RepID=A0AC60QDA0_IXOPE|nr:hypothetical protein HPB47_021568 [Ixodes persulcatus]